MGYTTLYKGFLKFKSPLNVNQIKKLSGILGEDCRQHPEWNAADHLTYIDLEFTSDYTALQWNGSEKDHDMVAQVNLIIRLVNTPDEPFVLEGGFLAHGEEVGDVWRLVMVDNVATYEEITF